MTYIEPTPPGGPPEIEPVPPPREAPEHQPGQTPEERPEPEPGGGKPGDSRPHDA